MRRILLALAVALIAIPLSAATVSVSGSHTIYVKPDMATFTITASSLAETTEEAMGKATDMIEDATTILMTSYAVPRSDISTSYISAYPERRWEDGKEIIIGQRAEQSINVTIHDIDDIGSIYSSLMTIDGISVTTPVLDKEDKSQDLWNARMGAMLNAYDKASAYARAGGYSVGDLVSISDGTTPSYGPMYARVSNVLMAESAMDGATGVSAEFYLDDIAITSSISVVWELDKFSGTPWVVQNAKRAV